MTLPVLACVVENYLELDKDETARFDAEVRREERQEVGKMIQTFSEALADSKAEGEAKGVRGAIVLLARSFHKILPAGFEEKLNAINNLDRLYQIMEQIPRVRSLEEIAFEPAH